MKPDPRRRSASTLLRSITSRSPFGIWKSRSSFHEVVGFELKERRRTEGKQTAMISAVLKAGAWRAPGDAVARRRHARRPALSTYLTDLDRGRSRAPRRPLPPAGPGTWRAWDRGRAGGDARRHRGGDRRRSPASRHSPDGRGVELLRQPGRRSGSAN